MTTNETPTPRTDALRLKMAQLGWPSDGEPVAMLMASHGELERELAEARKQLADWQVLQATTEQELAAERKDHAATADMLTTLRCELDDERALAGRLAAELEPAAWLCGYDHPNSAEQALAAWKEVRRE